MPFITWDDNLYSMGQPTVDGQHRRLFDLINQLHDATQAGKGNEAVGAVLGSLIDYVNVHFAAEERLMAACGYPGLEAHRQDHARLTQRVLELQQRFQQGHAIAAVQLLDFLGEWLSSHIQCSDRKYVSFLVKGVA